ncbi:MAG: tetratricopeptide repeat protein [Candidatus Heimdallarchaeota archaeon]|nr:tetratricopeptide repeat protein [Candidatus Heimdallarchaeota archaeon]MCK5048484.1 tetratricopeptide repeat protein [Candidatus Heimdallarchaeota archaeon]
MFIRIGKKNYQMSKEGLGLPSETVLESRDQVEHLISHGKLEEAMEILEGRKNEDGIEELRWRIVESRCRNKRGECEQVIEIAEKIKKEIDELEEPVDEKGESARKRIMIDTLIEQVWALQRLGRVNEGLEKVEEGIKLIEELEERDEKEEEHKDKERKAGLLNNKGLVYVYKSELDQALEFHEESLTIREELKNKQLIAQSLNNIGFIYHKKGELNQALEYYEKGLPIFKEKRLIAHSLNNIGIIYRLKGELGHALEYYEKSLVIREEAGNKQDIAYSLINIGVLHQELGALDMALNLLNQSLVIQKEIGNKLDVASLLFLLITVTIDLEEIKQARGYLTDLQLINEQEDNKLVNLSCRLAEALVLKTSKRRKNLVKAEEILEKIIEETEEEIIEHRLTIQALVNLSELLLEELRLTGEEEILEEVEEKVDKLLKIAKEQQSYTILTESYWLKAQLALVRLDLKEARNLLTQAQAMAEDKGLEKLARKISSEHDQLLEQLDQWEELLAKDASITERVKIANLEELIGWMVRKREIKIEEKEDEPVMLMLVAKSGIPIYSKQFDQTKELQDILISGFLTSINTFVQQAFEVKGQIKRITHEEYTLSFDQKESILFCYVYEGQSYTAMKKLEKLITEVHESEIWSALEEVGKTGYGLKMEEKDQMEGMMGKIFVKIDE